MHKPFKKIDLEPPRGDSDNTSVEQPALEPEEKPRAINYGERVEIVNTPYRDSPHHYPSLNVTCNPAELQLSLRKQREDCAKTVAQNDEYRRVPKGARTLKRLESDDADKPETKRTDR